MAVQVDLKVVLLGLEYGGKSSLVERYINSRFLETYLEKAKRKYEATIGAAYACKRVQIDSTSKPVTLGIWDTAGSERFEAISRMYYRNAKAAIICFDLTDAKSFIKAKLWAEELQKNEGSCRVYLCGTKKDLVNINPEARQVNERLVLNYANEIGATVFETSSKTGEGVNSLFIKIVFDYLNFSMSQETSSNGIRLNRGTNLPQNSWCWC